MKFKQIATWMCMVALLLVSSYGFAAGGSVRVGTSGITFPDDSIQSTAAHLPICSSGEVIVNNQGSWLCGSILPVDKGIATCVNSVCSISACQPTFGSCDGDALNGCESSLLTPQHCGSCNNVCGPNEICSGGTTCVLSPTSPASIAVSATPAAGFINGQQSVVVTANVQQLATGPVPPGTTVNFAITSGSGTLSGASATTDALGNASVTLNSTVEGSVTVTASASPAPNNSAVIAFTNPNKPGAIVLSATPSSGIANNIVPVTLTATVSPANLANGTIANGTPVTFTIIGGTGTLTGGVQTLNVNTVNGVATVILNSTVAGSVDVKATAGTSPVATSNTVSVPFITQPTLAIVKVATTGTLSGNTKIGGITAIVSANPSNGLSIADSDVTLSGSGAGALNVPNTTNVSAVTIGLITFSGILTGEFTTLQYHIAPGKFPTAGDFSVALTGLHPVIDTVGADIPGIGVTIQSVTIQ